jgi:hypothetical protein
MNKKKNLLKLFTEDSNYNYHLIKTEEPIGHLIYVIKEGEELDKEIYEFKTTLIAEELMIKSGVNFEKFAPSIFFTEESNTEELKDKLNENLTENVFFSNFIEEIKDE